VSICERVYICKFVLNVVCSEPQGMCYIETANLDGETNLKLRQVIFAVIVLCSAILVSVLSLLGEEAEASPSMGNTLWHV